MWASDIAVMRAIDGQWPTGVAVRSLRPPELTWPSERVQSQCLKSIGR